MKTSNLLIVGGLVLAGGFLFLRKKKPKTDTQELFKDNLIPNEPVEDISVNKISEKQALITPKEATVYATKTIAEVNSLMVKYPPLTAQQFLDNYNQTYGTNLIMSGDAIVGFSFVAPNQPQVPSTSISTSSRFGNVLNQVIALQNQGIRTINEEVYMASMANSRFKGQQMTYTRWKSDFATVYSDLKNYYSTLTKEEADIKLKFLPKLIIKSLMGDNDPRVRADFYSQEEIIDLIDNSGIKDTDKLLESALGNFFRNYKISIGQYSGQKTPVTITTKTIN